MQQAFCRFFVYDDFDNLLLASSASKKVKAKPPFDKIIKGPYRSEITNIIRPTRIGQTVLIVCLKGRMLATYTPYDSEDSVSFIIDKPIALNGQYDFICVPLDEEVVYYVADVYDQTWDELVEALPNKYADLADVVIAAD